MQFPFISLTAMLLQFFSVYPDSKVVKHLAKAQYGKKLPNLLLMFVRNSQKFTTAVLVFSELDFIILP